MIRAFADRVPRMIVGLLREGLSNRAISDGNADFYRFTLDPETDRCHDNKHDDEDDRREVL